MNPIKRFVVGCKICVKFRKVLTRGYWGQPSHSLKPEKTVLMDDIGPLKTEKRGVKSIFCTIDSCTRMGGDCKFRNTFSRNVIKGIQQWVFQHGSIVRVVSDNSAYFSSEEWRQWCASKGIEHEFIALHRHESTGLMEKYQ